MRAGPGWPLSWLELGDVAGPTGRPPRCLPVSPQVQECLRQFTVTGAQLRQIQSSLLGSMEQALRGRAGPAPAVRMLPTYVGSTPHGTGGWHRLRCVARPAERVLIWERGRGGGVVPYPLLHR